jgi:hypothetical protein
LARQEEQLSGKQNLERSSKDASGQERVNLASRS